MTRHRARRLGAGIVILILLAFLVDRVALYAWGLGVLRFRRSLHETIESMYARVNAKSISISIADLRWDELLFLESESGPTDINFMKSSVRPDCIRMDRNGITIWYLPPGLAWTTRLFPFYSGPGARPRSYRPVDHYQYMLTTHGTGKWAKPVVGLYAGPDRRPVPLTVARPELFP